MFVSQAMNIHSMIDNYVLVRLQMQFDFINDNELVVMLSFEFGCTQINIMSIFPSGRVWRQMYQYFWPRQPATLANVNV